MSSKDRNFLCQLFYPSGLHFLRSSFFRLERGVDANRNSRGVYSQEFLVGVCRPVLQIPLFFFVNISPALYYLNAWNRQQATLQETTGIPARLPPPHPHPGRTP